ncbi:MAG TPA: hypothetical protein VJR25_11695 [Microbacterium sp.]|uniref:hypothetical protein n=1 Tax=Microbacterium sp. TaxID=51671 RepID=UPI002B478E3D|nr:hypothetical protein [Microbacterium sp.]HKT57424.1 hypothetical protein [Microbacterium sp.]
MDSRQSMMIGGAAVAVVTLAVASAVTIGSALALNDASGQALAQSAISLPGGIQRVAHSTAHTDAVTVAAPAPATVARSTSRTVADAQSVSASTATRATASASSAHRSTTAAANSGSSSAGTDRSAAAAPAAAQAARQSAVAAAERKVEQELARLAKLAERTVHPHRNALLIATPQISSLGTIQTPAIAAGDESGTKESPSSAGSKKEQSPRSPDARD